MGKTTTKTTKQYIFTLFFKYDFENKKGETRERQWAEEKRDRALAYLQRLFESKAQFSCVAKDEGTVGNTPCLMLRGYVNLHSPCTPAYAKRLLGRYSSCRPSYFGDVVSLCRFVHVDRDLVVTGRLPHVGGHSIKNLKSFAGDPKLVVKILLDSIDRKDFEQHKEETRKEEDIVG